MFLSSTLTVPNLGTMPFEPTSPEFSDLSSPLSQSISLPENDNGNTKATKPKQTNAHSDKSPVRRSKRERKPTTKLDQATQQLATEVSPKRRRTGVGQWVSPPATPISGIPLTSKSIENCAHSQRSSPRSNVSNSRGRGDNQLAPTESPDGGITISPPVKAVAKLHIVDKDDIVQDLQNAFFAKVHQRVYRPTYDEEDLEKYFDKFGRKKNRIENCDHATWKEQTLWPGFDARNPTYYDGNGRIVAASSDGDKASSNQGSEAPSPSLKDSRSGQTGKNGKQSGRYVNKPNKGRGSGKDRESPEPPGKPILDQDERTTLAHIRQRQVELRKFFSSVGSQQKDALEIMASRELSKLHRKSKHHTKSLDYDEVIRSLQDRECDVQEVIHRLHQCQIELANTETSAQESILTSQFKQRVEDAQREHIQGAQGDLVIFRKAHLTAKDETRTNNGSDIVPYFPRYHELPEADAGPRGYTSTHIQDEKPFKDHLASYDEQANQEVIDDDIVAPVAQSVAEENARRQQDVENKVRFEALLTITREELRQERGYLIPRPKSPPENPQFALSRLADCAEYISRGKSEKEYIFMPLAPADIETFPLNHLERIPMASKTEDSRPSTSASQRRLSSAKKPLVQRQKSLSLSAKRPEEDTSPSQQPHEANNSLPLIAPAPSRRPSLSVMPHHAVPFTQMPPPPTTNIPPSPSQTTSRRSSLAPLLISRPPSAASPPNVSLVQSPASIPPPPSPSRFGGPLYPPLFPSVLGQPPPPPRPGYPFSQPHYHPAQPPPPPRFERPPPSQSPLEYNPPPPPSFNIAHRFPSQNTPIPRARVGGPRREPGQITFTPAQTPDSERFKNPPQPQPLPPGQAVYRPSSLQQLNSTKSVTPVVNTTIPPDTNTRSQQAADVARQTATINQGQGAGPKGGRRILLPKRY